ncbi:MAG TPA: ABC transporter substrate-binding protein [Polyangia bacterium]|nr:ABC transporter substrate-binding protein [Polyangia bacterium]
MVRLGLYVVLLFAACAAGQSAPSLPGTFGSGEPLPPPVAPEPGAPTMAAPTMAAPMTTAPTAIAPATTPPPTGPGGPGTPDLAAPDLAAPDPGADADFREAKGRFDAGDREGARTALEAFENHYPQNSARSAVDLMLARLALLRGDPSAAKTLLDPLVATPPDPGTGSGARYYLGLAETRLGHFAEGRRLLLPYLPPAGASAPDDGALVELRGALAEATAGVGELSPALELWDAYARGGREPEKAYARERVTEIVAKLTPDAAAQAFAASPEKGLARALLGPSAAAYLRARGDAAGAATVESESAIARRALGLEQPGDSARGTGAGDPGRFGLALALSGKFQPVGEAALRAALLATGAPAGKANELFVRDTGAGPERAIRGVSELARDESVIGILAASDQPSLAAAAAAAAENQVPTLDLDDGPGVPGSPTFQLVHTPASRAAALVHAALKLGVREFATIGPDTQAGQALRRAFKSELAKGEGHLVADVSYPPGSTSFTSVVAAIKKTRAQAIFVADNADRLELIAPALAAADLWPAPWGKKPPAAAPGRPHARNLLLLSTANGLSPRLLTSAGRYVQGALLSPGFFPAAGDARAIAFVDAYRATYGRDPHATEAYAFDGVNLLRAVTGAGARTRADVLRALYDGTFEGLTGALRFGPDHARADEPRIYLVEGDQINVAR